MLLDMGYEDADLLADCAAGVLARHEPDTWRHRTDDQWHHVWPIGHRPAGQGWKLHLPATPLSACFVLSRSVEVLARHRCMFKFAKSMRELQLLIEPNADRAGAGKFMTIYPDDDEQAVRLAEELHEVTLGLPGQAILSDRRYRPNSQVYYRYGTFVPTTRLSDDGEYVQMLRNPAGELVRDQRGVGRPTPDWITDDPFQAEAPELPQVPESVLVGGLYKVHTAIRQSNRGGIYFATDTATGEEIVLKRFRRHTVATVQGTDARQLARAESRMLHALSPSGAAPKPHALFSHDLDFFVSQQRIDGQVLRRYVARTIRPTADGTPALDTKVLLDLARQLVDLVAKVHEVGYVHGDLTPNNVMVAEGNRLVLIDLESALRTWEVGYRMSTPGYTAPEERARERSVWAAPDIAVDLYGLGATLFHLASGGHPPPGRGSRMPELVRLTAAHNPAVAALQPVLSGLLDDDPRQRPSLDQVREALRSPCTDPAPADPQPGSDRLIDDMLARIEHTASPDAEWLWSPSKEGRRYDPCAVHSGAAGVLTVLDQALAAGYPVESTVDVAARWLAKRIGDEPRVLPGLVFGRAGTALALTKAGTALRDEGVTGQGLRLARQLPTDWPVPDVWTAWPGPASRC